MGRHSDTTGERIWHIAIPLIVGGAAFAWSAASLPLSLTMVALTFATLGIYCAIGTFWSLPTAILTGTGAAAGLALVNSVGNLGGLVGPTIVGIMKQGSGDFMGALMFPRRGVGARRRDHPAVRPCGTQARHRGSCHDPLRRVVQ